MHKEEIIHDPSLNLQDDLSRLRGQNLADCRGFLQQYAGPAGYTVLATFDALAYHLFSISCRRVTYELDSDEEEIEASRRLCSVKLSAMNLQIGERLEMIYDFSCDQLFDLGLTGIQDMPCGYGRAYP